MKRFLSILVFAAFISALMAENKVIVDTSNALRQYEIPKDQQSGMALQVKVQNDPWNVQVKTNAEPMTPPNKSTKSRSKSTKSRSKSKRRSKVRSGTTGSTKKKSGLQIRIR